MHNKKHRGDFCNQQINECYTDHVSKDDIFNDDAIISPYASIAAMSRGCCGQEGLCNDKDGGMLRRWNGVSDESLRIPASSLLRCLIFAHSHLLMTAAVDSSTHFLLSISLRTRSMILSGVRGGV